MDIELAKQLMESGVSVSKISKQLGIHHEKLRKALQGQGIDTRGRHAYQAVSFEMVDPLWLAEFRGLFFGEGSVYIHRQNRKDLPRPGLRPDINISLAENDLGILQECSRVLGGGISHVEQKHEGWRTMHNWKLVGFPNVAGIIPYLLNSALPSKKHAELLVMQEFCELRKTIPRQRISEADYQRLEFYYHRLRELKRL